MRENAGQDKKTWDERFAKLVTNVINPPLVAGVGVFVMAGWLGGGGVFYWAGFFVFVVAALPTLYTVWLLKTGKISAFFMPKREDRIRTIASMVITNTLAVVVMIVWKAPFILIAFGSVGILQAVLILLITLYWKISAHMIGIAGLATFMAVAFGGWWTMALLMIPLVAWARIHLDSHSITEVFGGIILGGTIIGTATGLISYFCGGIGLTCG
jgi:membrane-associated phospholipid phosphatase